MAAIVEEEDRAELVALRRESGRLMVWMFTLLEVEAALARQIRQGRLTAGGAREARALLSEMESSWDEISAVEPVRAMARRLVQVHPLASGDALQLAAALVAAHDVPDTPAFVTLDRQLATAAEKEGFLVQPD